MMSLYRIRVGSDVDRLVGLESATTLALKFLSGSDYPRPWLFVEAFRREGDEMAERHCWEFPRIGPGAEVTISVVDRGSPDLPDESDKRPGHLSHDERIVVKEGIQRTEYMISQLEAELRVLDQKGKPSDLPAKLYCSFCGKSQEEAIHLVAGPGVFICEACIQQCNEILAERKGKEV